MSLKNFKSCSLSNDSQNPNEKDVKIPRRVCKVILSHCLIFRRWSVSFRPWAWTLHECLTWLEWPPESHYSNCQLVGNITLHLKSPCHQSYNPKVYLSLYLHQTPSSSLVSNSSVVWPTSLPGLILLSSLASPAIQLDWPMYCLLHEHHDHQPLGFYLNLGLTPSLSFQTFPSFKASPLMCDALLLHFPAPHFPHHRPRDCVQNSCLPSSPLPLLVSFFRTWFVSGQWSQYCLEVSMCLVNICWVTSLLWQLWVHASTEAVFSQTFNIFIVFTNDW